MQFWEISLTGLTRTWPSTIDLFNCTDFGDDAFLIDAGMESTKSNTNWILMGALV